MERKQILIKNKTTVIDILACILGIHMSFIGLSIYHKLYSELIIYIFGALVIISSIIIVKNVNN